jgi:predicted glycoside hydrolase/deacetylase ChbG (UPF0249 family)
MKTLFSAASLFMLLATCACSNAQQTTGSAPIRLIVRADDMGVTHATNTACMDVYKNGIARSVEVMVPTPWFMEAVDMLKNDTSYDVGIHLLLTNEWKLLKWRPLTAAKSLRTEDGFFYPTIWKGKPDFPSLNEHSPDWKEVEEELRAQIEMAIKHIPRISHLSSHMYWNGSHAELQKIYDRLSAEYKLPIIEAPLVERFPGLKGENLNDPKRREAAFIAALEELQPGKTYMTVTHPAYNTDEMSSLYTVEYSDVGADRAADHYVLTSKKVQQALKKKGIVLVSCGDVARSGRLSGSKPNTSVP